MNVLLISANTETFNMPTLPMGLGSVAAAVKRAGHRVLFLDLMAEATPLTALENAVHKFAPDVIGISIRNVDDQASDSPRFLIEKTRPVVSLCKRLSAAPVVLGGAGYSLFPESMIEYLGADMGIQGEGEGAFVELLELIEAGSDPLIVPGLFLRGKGLQAPRAYQRKLDDWLFPDPELFDVRLFQDPAYYLPVQTRRGCPLNCSYCSTGTIEGRQIRKRSPEAVVRELTRWQRAGFSRIFFVDNTFNLPAGYARALCKQLKASGMELTWRCILYPARIDKPLVRAMAEAGCSEVSLGFESGNQQVLAGMRKKFDIADIRNTSDLLAGAGIRRIGFLLLGGPDETRTSVEESMQFVDSLNLDMVKLTIGIRIYPYTQLADIARAEGVIDEQDDLLRPKFYITSGLENWLRQTVLQWMSARPNWVM